MLAGRHPADSFEGGAEREPGAVADLAGDGVDGGSGFAQQIRGQGQSPGGQESHWGLPDDLVEAAGNGGPGHPDAAREQLDTLDGHNAWIGDGVQRTLGRPARDLHDWARVAAAAGAWPAPDVAPAGR